MARPIISNAIRNRRPSSRYPCSPARGCAFMFTLGSLYQGYAAEGEKSRSGLSAAKRPIPSGCNDGGGGDGDADGDGGDDTANDRQRRPAHGQARRLRPIRITESIPSSSALSVSSRYSCAAKRLCNPIRYSRVRHPRAEMFGGQRGIRTPDILRVKQAL
jgi:hypothetical protein